MRLNQGFSHHLEALHEEEWENEQPSQLDPGSLRLQANNASSNGDYTPASLQVVSEAVPFIPLVDRSLQSPILTGLSSVEMPEVQPAQDENPASKTPAIKNRLRMENHPSEQNSESRLRKKSRPRRGNRPERWIQREKRRRANVIYCEVLNQNPKIYR